MAALKPPIAFKLTGGSPEAKVAPVGCAVASPISGLLHIEGIPVEGLVDTGASVTCLGFAIWWRYRAQWGSLEPFAHTVRGAHGKPLQIAGRTQHLDIQWGEARGRASFIVIVGLESPPCLIGMDIMRPLRVRIDVTEGTATPAQPDPQTIHLNAAQTRPQPTMPLSEKKTLFPQLRKPQHRELLSLGLPLPRLLCLRNRAGCQPQRRPWHPHQPLFSLLHLLDPRLLTPTWLILTLLAVLGFCRLQIFHLRQPAL